MKLNLSILQFDLPIVGTLRLPEKLRGFFSKIYREQDLFHNHDANGKDLYRYPKIQYKIINKRLAAVGINEGSDLIRSEFIKFDSVILQNKKYPVLGSSLDCKQSEFELTAQMHRYRFNSVWLALNDLNYKAYQQGQLNLNNILIGNLLSDMKGLGIWCKEKITVDGHFYPRKVIIDNIPMIGFKGSFTCNVLIPEFLGTGKRKSIGFGVIVREKE